jgi:hypothetical protein
MSASFFKKNCWRLIIWPLWVLAGFFVAQLLTVGSLQLLNISALESLDKTVFSTAVSVIIYVLTLVIVIGIPWWLKHIKTTRQDLGILRLPSWSDIGLAPVGFIVYIIIAALLLWLATTFLLGINLDQVQETGFGAISRRHEYLLAFSTLVVLAPLAEEILFRGYLCSKLRKFAPAWVTILVTSLVFGVIHGQWNVGLDTFALSLVLCTLREITGSIWSGVLLHMLKNGIAFYFLFINPMLLNTL